MRTFQPIRSREIGEKADRIYESLKAELEPRHHGKFIAIEVESGDYFLGDTVEEADQQGRERYPEGFFCFKRVGHRAAGRVPWV
jgi:hypothetical protein